jgi:hypothetical protein
VLAVTWCLTVLVRGAGLKHSTSHTVDLRGEQEPTHSQKTICRVLNGRVMPEVGTTIPLFNFCTGEANARG